MTRHPSLPSHPYQILSARKIPLTIFPLILTFAGCHLALTPSKASAATDTAGSTSGYYVSVSSADTLALHLNATPGGTVGSVQDTLTVSSNTPNGYKVYISSPTSSTGSNYLCPAGVTPSTSACFVPTASADSLLNLSSNSWGYSLNGISYSPVPLLGSEDTIISKSTASSEAGTTMPIYFGVKADMAMSGSYTGSIMYTTIANTTNTSNKATISPTTVKPAGGETLTVNIPYISSRTTEEIKSSLTIGIGGSVTDGGTSCTVTNVTKITSPYDGIQVTCTTPAKSAGSYNVVATVALPQGGVESWVASSQITYVQPDITSLTYLQDFATNTTACSQTETGVTALLKDKRDNKQYRVRKLKDGKCWMIDNLRLGTAGQALTLTTADSNVSSTKTIPDSQIVDADATASWAGDYSSKYHIVAREDTTFEATTDAGIYTLSNEGYGNLYSWNTAIVFSTSYDASQGTNATQSICPKGWVLPQNAPGAGSFQTLYNSYSSSDAMREVATASTAVTNRGPEFKPAGYYPDGGVRDGGWRGYYWSRTAYGYFYGLYRAYNLSFFTSAVSPQSDDYQYYGLSVRCIVS